MKKNPHAVAMGCLGGSKRAQNLTPKQRSDAAKKAAEARWAKVKKDIPKKDPK